MINWLTAIFGFLALYGAAALVFVWTRPAGHSPESAEWPLILIILSVIAAGINEWRARRAKRLAAKAPPSREP